MYVSNNGTSNIDFREAMRQCNAKGAKFRTSGRQTLKYEGLNWPGLTFFVI